MTEPGPFEGAYFADIYGGDYDARNPRYKHRALLSALRLHQPSGSLLDIGCAYGRFLEVAAEEGGYTLSGCDVSEHAAAIAGERLASRDVRVRQGGVLDDPFPGETFDVITMFDVIEHVDDLEAAFASVKTRLTEGGVFAFSVPVYDGPVGVLVEAMDLDPTHVHKIGRDAWLQHAQDHGFRVLRWMGIMRYFLASRVYLHLQTTTLRRHSPAVLVICAPAR
ncbi:MAG: class I SAM-dependent methyltransferase [Deltaproteobacteria bacterium]|nr:class I SAM-dependent methyltransferase [Deltaproteobacteria bacterium]